MVAIFGSGYLLFAQERSYEERVSSFQDSINRFQKDPKTTQLIEDEYEHFDHLEFFPVNESFRVEARFVEEHDPHQFKLTYSDDLDVPLYVTSGILFFSIEGQNYSLHVYQNVKWLSDPKMSDHLLVPFKDWTNGPVSYGGGRFLDLKKPQDGETVILDFNFSYNPPCAYNYYMACPLIPDCNHLEREITAGILLY